MKVVVLGAYRVGKSSLVSRFTSRNTIPDPDPTIGVSCSTTSIHVFEQYHRIKIMDLSGNDYYERLYRQYVQNAHVAIVVYDITNYSTFKVALEKIKYVQNIHSTEFPIMLVGNKIDRIAGRRVKTDTALGTVKSRGNIFFIEVSALRGINTTEALKILSSEGARVSTELVYTQNDFQNNDVRSGCRIV